MRKINMDISLFFSKKLALTFFALVVLFSIPIYFVIEGYKKDGKSQIVENSSVVSGTVLVTIEDYFGEKDKSIEKYYLVTPENVQIPIDVSSSQKSKLLPGSFIGIPKKNLKSSKFSSVEGINILSTAQSTQETTGEKIIPVILVKFQEGNYPISRHNLENNILKNVRDYFSTASYGKMKLKTEAYGEYVLPSIDEACVTANWLRDVIGKADNDINFNNIDRFLVIYPGINNYNCPNGAASLGPSMQFYTNEGNINMAYSYMSLGSVEHDNYDYLTRTAIHELLHTFYLRHANGLDCKEKRSLDPPSCQNSEYFDAFDVMGGGNNELWHINVPHKQSLGWLDNSQILTVSQSGEYEISPIELDNSLPKGIKIFRQNGIGLEKPQYLYAEYRQPIPPDTFNASQLPWLTTNVYDGALVHIDTLNSPNATQLIDTSDDSTFSPYYSTLLMGKILVDPLTNVKLEVIGKSTSSLKIKVTFPDVLTPTNTLTPTKPPISTYTPTFSPSPTPTLAPSPTLTITPTTQPTDTLTSIPTLTPATIASPTSIQQIICDPDSFGKSFGIVDFSDLRLVRKELSGSLGSNKGRCGLQGNTQFEDLRRIRRIIAGFKN